MGKRWFASLNRGIGWKPATWQGWLIVFLYFVSVIASFLWVFYRSGTVIDFLFNFIVQFLIITIILSFICYFTGEKPKI